MNPNPGRLEWERPGGDAEWDLFEHVQVRETGGVAGFAFDDEMGQPTERLLELGPSTPWVFVPLEEPANVGHPEPDQGGATVPALGPENSEVPDAPL